MNNYNRLNYENCFSNNSKVYINEVPVSTESGFIEVHLTKDLGREIATGAVVTIYVNQTGGQVPVVRYTQIQNPTTIRLPVANPAGTLIRGPEYYFTSYNLYIEDEGYYNIATRNIRLFPNVTARFYYNLNRIIPGEDHDQITVIPPHPRDEVITE